MTISACILKFPYSLILSIQNEKFEAKKILEAKCMYCNEMSFCFLVSQTFLIYIASRQLDIKTSRKV